MRAFRGQDPSGGGLSFWRPWNHRRCGCRGRLLGAPAPSKVTPEPLDRIALSNLGLSVKSFLPLGLSPAESLNIAPIFARVRVGVTPKYVYLFNEGNAKMRDLLGGKGAGLAEMTRLRLPVPPGFTITTVACNAFSKAGKFPPGLKAQIAAALRKVETKAQRRLGDPKSPLLVSVRSGAKFSMPGMMDTVLNIGLNDEVVGSLAVLWKNERFAWDSYRRLLQMFGRIVQDIEPHRFESILERWKAKTAGGRDTDLTGPMLRSIVGEFKGVFAKEGKEFPQDPQVQLVEAVAAVFRSWNGKRAVDYRNFHKIRDDNPVR